MYPAHVRSIFTTIAILFWFCANTKVLTVLSSNAPSALFEPLKQRQHNDSQPTVILWDQALCGERAICSSNQACTLINSVCVRGRVGLFLTFGRFRYMAGF